MKCLMNARRQPSLLLNKMLLILATTTTLNSQLHTPMAYEMDAITIEISITIHVRINNKTRIVRMLNPSMDVAADTMSEVIVHLNAPEISIMVSMATIVSSTTVTDDLILSNEISIALHTTTTSTLSTINKIMGNSLINNVHHFKISLVSTVLKIQTLTTIVNNNHSNKVQAFPV